MTASPVPAPLEARYVRARYPVQVTLHQPGLTENCEIAANSDPLRGVFASKADPSDAVSVSSSRWRLEGISGDDWCGSDWRYPAGVF